MNEDGEDGWREEEEEKGRRDKRQYKETGRVRRCEKIKRTQSGTGDRGIKRRMCK